MKNQNFRAIANSLDIEVNLIRKNSIHLGNLQNDCMIVAFSLMTGKPYNIIAESLNRIAAGNRDRTECSVGIDYINEYNKNSSNKYVFAPLKKNGICYNIILKNRDKDLMFITENHAFCYIKGKIQETKSNYLETDINGCKDSGFVFERRLRSKSYKFKKIEYKIIGHINDYKESEFLLKSLKNITAIKSKENEFLCNFPILTLSRVLNISYKEAAISLIMHDNNCIGICSKLLFSYIDDVYESNYWEPTNHTLYSFLTSDKILKTKYMIIYIRPLIGLWKDKLIPVGIKDGVILSDIESIEIILISQIEIVQSIGYIHRNNILKNKEDYNE